MNLSRCFPSRQLLFVFAVFVFGNLFNPGANRANAQQATLVTKDGKTQSVKIIGVSGGNLQVQVEAGKIGIPLASIAQVNNLPAPPELAAAQAAFEAKDFQKAFTADKAVLDKYKGLPTDWAQQAATLLGDIYVAKKNLDLAESAYREFERLYPNAGPAQLAVGLARIAVARNDFATAKQRVDPILADALKEKNPPRSLALIYSQAFFISGQVKENGGDFSGALEDYLRTVAVFWQDRVAVAAAQERADALRKAHAVTAP